MRLGFPTGIYGVRGMPAHDARLREEGGSLGVSLAYLRDILNYLAANNITMYRLHAELVPELAKRSWGDVEHEIMSCEPDLALLAKVVSERGIRLSFHPQTAVVLNTPNEDHLGHALVVLSALAALLDRLAAGADGVIVLHVGGVYGDAAGARRRFCDRYLGLPESVRRRVVLENDDRRFCLADVLSIYDACGVPIVFDPLHHRVLSSERIPMADALRLALATWPRKIVPKVHYATARSDMRTWGSSGRIKPPTWTEHADFVNPFDFAAFVALADGQDDLDIMLEAKARDLALLKLRRDLARYEPELAERLA